MLWVFGFMFVASVILLFFSRFSILFLILLLFSDECLCFFVYIGRMLFIRFWPVGLYFLRGIISYLEENTYFFHFFKFKFDKFLFPVIFVLTLTSFVSSFYSDFLFFLSLYFYSLLSVGSDSDFIFHSITPK